MSHTLREVADAFRATMPPRSHVSVFPIEGLDRIGIPVMQANLILPDEPATIGYGYGFEPDEAEVGAVGELCEEVHVHHWVKHAPRIDASYARMKGERPTVDPLTLCLQAGSAYTDDMTLPWVEARRWPSGEPVWVPREWVAAYPYQLDEKPVLITPITNGLGAGFDLPHAIAHGVMELLQRDGNVINFRALDQGVVVTPDGIKDPMVRELLDRLHGLGIEVTIKLANTEFGIPNIYVVGNDTGKPTVPIQVTSCGEAAHPDRERSLRKALLEFCGSRSRKAATHGPIDVVSAFMPPDYVQRQMAVAMLGEEENRALDSMAEWVAQDAPELRRRLADTVFSEKRRVAYTDLPDAGAEMSADSTKRLDWLTAQLAAAGMEILYVDCSPAGSQVKVVKTIVPGLESETMSYHRIGWRGVQKLRQRNDRLVLDRPIDGAQRVLLRPDDEARCGGPAWFDAALCDRIVGKLYPMYRESGPFSAQLRLRAQRGAA